MKEEKDVKASGFGTMSEVKDYYKAEERKLIIERHEIERNQILDFMKISLKNISRLKRGISKLEGLRKVSLKQRRRRARRLESLSAKVKALQDEIRLLDQGQGKIDVSVSELNKDISKEEKLYSDFEKKANKMALTINSLKNKKRPVVKLKEEPKKEVVTSKGKKKKAVKKKAKK